jgi:hypothetical protein
MNRPGPLSGSGPFVCRRCVGDDELKAWVRANAESRECTFCGRAGSRAIAADADSLVAFVSECLAVEFEDASEMVPVEGGEYVSSTMTTQESLWNEGVLEEAHEDFVDYLVGSLPDNAWVPVDFFSLHPRETLTSGWERFAHAIKHETRYLFFPPRQNDEWEQHDEIRPEDMLTELGRVVRDHNLVRRLPIGTKLYRVRVHADDVSPTALGELAAPPAEACTRSNRMSPAGISMLYVAFDAATAIAETRDPETGRLHGTLATFELETPARIADFVRLPRAPGLFTPGLTRSERGRLQFLHGFADEISKPVGRDRFEHIEYVPTQVVTEYLRFRFRAGKRSVHGLRYRSARQPGGVNLALFLGHSDFVPDFPAENGPAVRFRVVSHEPIDLA